MSVTIYSIFDHHFVNEGSYDDKVSDEFDWVFFVEYAQRTEFTHGDLLNSIRKHDPDFFIEYLKRLWNFSKKKTGQSMKYPKMNFKNFLKMVILKMAMDMRVNKNSPS